MRVFAFGTGPGPKNVGIELDDGTRTVVAYRTYKYKYQPKIGGRLSEKVYTTVKGAVQFNPKTREANGKTVTDIAIRDRGSDGQVKLINITIWPEFQLAAPIQRGDFICADGSIETRTFQGQDGGTKESIQLNPTSLVHVPQVPRADRVVVQAPAGGGGGQAKAPF